MSARPLINMPHGIEAYSVAQREFDSINGEIRRSVEARQAAHESRLAQLKAEFILMVLKKDQSEAERLTVGQYLEQNLTRDMQVDLTRALLNGEQLRAHAIVLEQMNAAAEHYADEEA